MLSLPKLRSVREYLSKFKEVWRGSCIGKILIGIVCYIGVVQAWLLLVAFLGVVIWTIKKRVMESKIYKSVS